MPPKTQRTPRREDSLSRDRIVEASIALLDNSGEAGLTFRALSERLATGPGALYWHIANKHDLLIAASDAVIAQAMDSCAAGETPQAAVRAIALALFDVMDAHPWVGSALARAPGQLPAVRIVERLGQQLRALGVPDDTQWTAVSALLSYILGVGGQNAANAQFARVQGVNRSDFLGELSNAWSQLDPAQYPFVRSVAEQFRTHDDRADFLAGIDLLLKGLAPRRSR